MIFMDENNDSISSVLSVITGSLAGLIDLPKLLDRIVSLSMSLLHAEVCSIFLEYTEKPEYIRMVAGSGFARKLVGKAEYQRGEGLTGYIAKSGAKLNIRSKEDLLNVVDNEGGEPVWKGKHDILQWPSGNNEFRNMIALPLKIGDHIFGVMKVENKELAKGLYFYKGDEEIFNILVNFVAMAIDNARLHARLAEQQRVI
jgi:phosphoserine phosphatase RsbU/P